MKQRRLKAGASTGMLFQQAAIQFERGKLVEAERLARKILKLIPDHSDTIHLLGVIAGQRGRYESAERLIRRAIKKCPSKAIYHYSLGYILLTIGRLDEAVAANKRAVGLNPKFVRAYNNLGVALSNLDRPTEALEVYRRVTRLEPRHAQAHNNAGNTLLGLGQMEEAEASYRAALNLSPDYVEAHSNLLFLLAAKGARVSDPLLEEQRRWEAVHGREGRSQPLPVRPREPLTSRRLRVGYVSPDLRKHAVSYFFEPLLAAHDNSGYEIFCYDAGMVSNDATRERLRGYAEHWRIVVGKTDAEVAKLIYNDQIDILIDLAGHTRGGRLKIFTYRPAPVQAAYLGFFASTGLQSMHYWISDAMLHPIDTPEHTVESIYRLPRCAFCYKPPPEAPQVSPCPSMDERVVFGSFSNISKLTDDVITTWSRLLHALPGSRMLLMDRPLCDPATRQFILDKFAHCEISSDRLLVKGGAPLQEYLATYAMVDVVLDPFPRTGGTTTAEALWMGVPVVTMAGQCYVERISASKLAAVGLEDLIAHNSNQYIDTALSLAHDPGRRLQLRTNLRTKMAGSPLCDGESLARAMESAYQWMWEQTSKRG
jgi:predicted O-linked N-acetylglucosamine transferase (SPINDLY family)